MKSIFHTKFSLIKIECEDGFFGYDCQKCHCQNKDEVCNKRTGKCKSGCQERWHGVNCTGMNFVYIYVQTVIEREMYIFVQQYSISYSTVMQNMIQKTDDISFVSSYSFDS